MAVTRKQLYDEVFPHFIRVANETGIDTTGWHLQNVYGNHYSILSENGRKISAMAWEGTGNAARGMGDMIRAWYEVPRG